MELYSKKFRQLVIQALESSNNVIATMPIYKNEFLEEIREREDAKIIKITRENREKIYENFI